VLELLTVSEMGRADRLAIASGVPGIDLMENAGRAVADAVSGGSDASRPIVVCAGPGNNGGDGFVAARLLTERGYAVRLVLLGDVDRLRGDAAEAARRFSGAIERPDAVLLDSSMVIVDALFGAGLDRNVEGAAADLIGAINGSGAHVVAVDLPSGINGDTGAEMGVAVRADVTVTFFRRKPGHLLLPGRARCGRTIVADIGIPEAVLEEIAPRIGVNAPPVWSSGFPVPTLEGNKYTRGHAVVLSGPMSSTGAARLSARGALRAGAGLVTIASPREALAVNAAANLAIMVREAEGVDGYAELLSDRRITVGVLGPGAGIGSELREKVQVAVEKLRAVILDADALTSFGDNPKQLFTMLKNHPESSVILTPHGGEFSRLFSSIEQIPSVKQKLEAARAASHETGAVVLLKGADTVVSSPDGRALIAKNAPPYLATAGAGDVLAGIIAGLCTQGMSAFEAAAAGVWLHGEAAREAGPGLVAEDLPEALPKVYRRLFAELSPNGEI